MRQLIALFVFFHAFALMASPSGNPPDDASDIPPPTFEVLEKEATLPTREDGHYDWSFRGPENDKEWAWMLNRMRFLKDFYERWQTSGDDRYLEALDHYWKDWIQANPYPNRISFSAPWRALEVARRTLHVWVDLYKKLEDVQEFPESTRQLIRESLKDHGDALYRYASFWGGNHLITEKLALLKLARAFPDFPDSDLWQQNAVETISSEIMTQTYPDGSYKELSNHYQRVALLSAQPFIEMLDSMEYPDKHLQVYKRVESMWNFFARVIRPDGFGPINNAGDLDKNAHFLESVIPEYERQDWQYIISNGKSGTPPEGPPDQYFPWAGQVFFRDDWSRDSHWAYFDAGPYGTAHQHNDRLHLSVFADHRPLLTDQGRYTYHPGPAYDYFTGKRGHNVILLDNQAVQPAPRHVKQPLPVEVDFSEKLSMARAKAPFPDSWNTTAAEHDRTVYAWKGRGWVVIDRLNYSGYRTIDAIWHFHPEVSQSEANHILTLVSSPSGVIREDFYGSESTPFAGWFSPEYNQKEAAIERHFKANAPGPQTFIWLIQPPSGNLRLKQDSNRSLLLEDGKGNTITIPR